MKQQNRLWAQTVNPLSSTPPEREPRHSPNEKACKFKRFTSIFPRESRGIRPMKKLVNSNDLRFSKPILKILKLCFIKSSLFVNLVRVLGYRTFISDLLKHLRWSIFARKVNGFQLWVLSREFCEIILDFWTAILTAATKTDISVEVRLSNPAS